MSQHNCRGRGMTVAVQDWRQCVVQNSNANRLFFDDLTKYTSVSLTLTCTSDDQNMTPSFRIDFAWDETVREYRVRNQK